MCIVASMNECSDPIALLPVGSNFGSYSFDDAA